jgi:predicted 3-demethylubiquinone-9 3-methyltransferase (glyoxalase superfamily)
MEFPSKIVPCLWFASEAEAAVRFYAGIFPNSRITEVTHYPGVGQEVHGQKAGTVLTVAFELAGQPFTALNGGPVFKFNEALSLQIMCDDQAEVDHYWNKLGDGGDPAAQQCGWLKDKFGLSWQIVPKAMIEFLSAPDKAAMQRAFSAMMEMKKLDIAALQRAFDGK